jgi:hypothetical protein
MDQGEKPEKSGFRESPLICSESLGFLRFSPPIITLYTPSLQNVALGDLHFSSMVRFTRFFFNLHDNSESRQQWQAPVC